MTPEDWGWRVTCRFSGDRFIVGCGNVDEAGPEEAPSAPSAEITWHAFPAAAAPFLRRLLHGREVALGLDRFDGELRALLTAEPGITLTEEP